MILNFPPINPEINSTYDTAQVGNSLFEQKLFSKLSQKPNDEWVLWVKSFADKMSFCHHNVIKEEGMKLVNSLLDFPDDSQIACAVRSHLEELVQTDIFLNKCINPDEYALNQAEQVLKHFREAVESTVQRSKIVAIDEVPEVLEINPLFISDPRIMLFNILSKSGKTQLSPIDDTIEMELALILAKFREQFLQKIIPPNEKDRAAQESYIKTKIQNRLSLIESYEKKSEVDEKIINGCYKRMNVTSFMDYILKGSGSLDKFRYTHINGKQLLFEVPIPKRQGYTNPQIMIDHVHFAINDQQNTPFKISIFKECLQSQFGFAAPEKIQEYFEGNSEKVSKAAIRALLYSTGYLK